MSAPSRTGWSGLAATPVFRRRESRGCRSATGSCSTPRTRSSTSSARMSAGSTTSRKCGARIGRGSPARAEVMRLALVCVGKLKAGPERLLFERYLKRLTDAARSAGLASVDIREISESRARRPEDRRAEEGAAILAAVPAGGALTLLDERGAPATSEEWAADIG